MFLFVCSGSPCRPQYDYHISLLARVIRAIKLLLKNMHLTAISIILKHSLAVVMHSLRTFTSHKQLYNAINAT